jgi:HK97 family phage major capsid protein
LRAGSVVLQSGVRVVTTERESIQWPKLSADVSPSWYEETDELVPGDPTFTTLSAVPRKLAHIVELSNEVIDDSDPSITDVLNAHLGVMLGLKLDYFLLEGSGTAPVIRGLKNVVGIQSVSMGTNGASLTSLDPIADAIGLLEASNATGPYVIVMPPRTKSVIRKLKDQQDRPLMEANPTSDAPPSVFGARVFTTSQLSTTETQGTSSDASSIYVYAPGEIVFVQRQDATIELDRSRLFNLDMSEMRAKLRADLIVPNPEAIVRIRGIRP